MADSLEDSSVKGQEEEGGGAVKSFLEHLEDLRWTLIKSGSALMIAMIICLVAGDWVFWILERPLIKSKAPVKLVFMDPAGPFVASLHLAFFGPAEELHIIDDQYVDQLVEMDEIIDRIVAAMVLELVNELLGTYI